MSEPSFRKMEEMWNQYKSPKKTGGGEQHVFLVPNINTATACYIVSSKLDMIITGE